MIGFRYSEESVFVGPTNASTQHFVAGVRYIVDTREIDELVASLLYGS